MPFLIASILFLPYDRIYGISEEQLEEDIAALKQQARLDKFRESKSEGKRLYLRTQYQTPENYKKSHESALRISTEKGFVQYVEWFVIERKCGLRNIRGGLGYGVGISVIEEREKLETMRLYGAGEECPRKEWSKSELCVDLADKSVGGYEGCMERVGG